MIKDREAMLREALKDLEWCKEKAGWTGRVACCPACFAPEHPNFLGYDNDAGEPRYEPAGHKVGCWLGAALAAPPESETAPPTHWDEPPWLGWFSCEGCSGWFNDDGIAYDSGEVLCDSCAEKHDEEVKRGAPSEPTEEGT